MKFHAGISLLGIIFLTAPPSWGRTEKAKDFLFVDAALANESIDAPSQSGTDTVTTWNPKGGLRYGHAISRNGYWTFAGSGRVYKYQRPSAIVQVNSFSGINYEAASGLEFQTKNRSYLALEGGFERLLGLRDTGATLNMVALFPPKARLATGTVLSRGSDHDINIGLEAGYYFGANSQGSQKILSQGYFYGGELRLDLFLSGIPVEILGVFTRKVLSYSTDRQTLQDWTFGIRIHLFRGGPPGYSEYRSLHRGTRASEN